MRARLALMAASIDCEMREVVLRNKPASMIALSAKGTVPVLQLQNGKVIDESIDVMHWALGQSDPYAWLDADPALTRRLIDRNDSSFKDELDRYKYHVRYPEHTQQHYRSRAETFLTELETLLRAHDGIGLVRNALTLADVAVFPFIRQFSRVEADWFGDSPYEHVKHWLHGLECGNLFSSVMKKSPPWVDGDPVTIFGRRVQ